MKSKRILVNKNPAYEKCPSCHKANVIRRSRARNNKEKLVKAFTFYRMFRCTSCGWRGYRSTITITIGSLQRLMMYIASLLILGFIILEILKRFI